MFPNFSRVATSKNILLINIVKIFPNLKRKKKKETLETDIFLILA